MRLFDNVKRADSSPASHAESTFAFLNRVEGSAWQEVREKLEEYFDAFPTDGRGDLRSRFRSNDRRQHVPAWWELYVSSLLQKLGWTVSVHPLVSNSSHRPDFLARRDGEAVYVEAAAVMDSGLVGEEDVTSIREGWIFDITNECESSDFHLQLEIVAHGERRPAKKEILQPLRSWLGGLDADVVTGAISEGCEVPALSISAAGWDLVYRAHPVPAEHRGRPGRVLGLYPVKGGQVDDETPLRKAVRKKSKRYGELDHPLMVAVLMAGLFAGDRDADGALYGSLAVRYVEGVTDSPTWFRQRDGVFAVEGSARDKCSAVMIGNAISPWNHHVEVPRLWENPWAKRALCDMQLPRFSCDDYGRLLPADNVDAEHFRHFGLGAAWPGFASS